ncbi:glycoside hydrolase family 26 protein [Pontibacter silvestris]|uniref:Mannan endo-1,4-beta-mannosidase n=1 Tax=Pontibacter silvestris TaxID=2305183 RepID=A0ABW4WYQ0_9BACT|nr:glycosyl hydrolase [Pontibacter silvestris]MCC9137600.1 glycoside hydrolase family 26 protein [Pontibacter silvestris]
MYRILFASFFALLFVNVSCTQKGLPTNSTATQETKNLYSNLKNLSEKGVMFGHQDDLAYGVGWEYEEGRSDVKSVVGEYPAVVGWDLGSLELGKDKNLDGVPFDKMRSYAEQIYAQGGLNTFSWHLNNPVDPAKTSWDKEESTIRKLFADQEAMNRYKSWLGDVATFLKSLKGPDGEVIPVVFRPLHEHTGSWFWWGKDYSTPEEYIKMWRFTVDYLRQEEGVDNILIAYSTDRFNSREDYLERYPGDKYVDIIGFDIYHRPQPGEEDNFVAEARGMVDILREIGQEKGKVWALTETGLETLPDADWWTNTLLPIIKDSGLSYVLVWRNGRPDHYYAPYPGQESAEDFKEFYNSPETLFGQDVANQRLYK